MNFTLPFKLEVKVLKIKKDLSVLSVTLYDVDSHYKWREKSRDSAVNISTRHGAGRSGVLIPAGATYFLQDVQTCYGAHTAFYSVVTGEDLSPRTRSGRGAAMVSHRHLAPMLRMGESIPPFPIHAVTACTKKFLLWSGITSSVLTFDSLFGTVVQNTV